MGTRNEQLARRRAYETAGYELHLSRPDIGLEVYTKQVGEQIIAKGFRGRAGKPAWFYQFRSSVQLEDYIAREISGCERAAEYKAQRKAERSAPASVDVGDVFVCSWGYDQTNVDYYQVTRVVSPVTVEIRPIGAVSWGTEYMQGRSVPAPDKFIGAPMRKRVQGKGDDAYVRITSFSHAYKMKPVVDGVPAYPSTHWTAYA